MLSTHGIPLSTGELTVILALFESGARIKLLAFNEITSTSPKYSATSLSRFFCSTTALIRQVRFTPKNSHWLVCFLRLALLAYQASKLKLISKTVLNTTFYQLSW